MIEEKIVIGKDTEFPLNGLLTLPEGDNAPFPAVIFVHGSGVSDMDSKVFAIRPFKDFAEGLAKVGVACIRYDKRFFTHAKKIGKMKTQITAKEEAIEDAILAANILKEDPRIDSSKIFIAGLSLGGYLAPRIADEYGKFAGMILLAAPARRLEVVMKDQMDDPKLKKPRGLLGLIVKSQMKKLLAKLENLYEISDEEAKNIPFGNGVSAYYFKDMGKKQVSEYLESNNIPILVLHGNEDFQVSTEKDFNEYKRILQNRQNATFKLYPDLNHVFMPSVCGPLKSPKKEYSKPQNVVNYVITDLANWIHSIYKL